MVHDGERLAFWGIVFTAAGALLTKMIEPFAKKWAANMRAEPDPSKRLLTEARANELIQQTYSRLLNETQEERNRLVARVAELEAKLTKMEAERVEMLAVAGDQKAQIAQLLTTIATQQKEIERQDAEIQRLRIEVRRLGGVMMED